MTKTTENREVRSDVFSMLLEDKQNALEIYNALNGSDYKDAELIEAKTLEKGISLTIRNDAAFIVDMNLNIYEHQSTYSRSLPLRLLIYISEIIKPYIKNSNIYSRRAIEIPTPHFVVFYNGVEKRPKKEILKLSDAFVHKMEQPELELICTAYNINPGIGDEILSTCKVLNEYAQFIDKVRYFASENDDNPIGQAIDWCIDNHILEDFLRRRKPEVLKNMTIDMTFERREELIRQEEYQEGLSKGKQLSIIELLEELGVVPDVVKEKIIAETDPETLSGWHKLSARCDSIGEFEKNM